MEVLTFELVPVAGGAMLLGQAPLAKDKPGATIEMDCAERQASQEHNPSPH
jgi:hypothetical protein